MSSYFGQLVAKRILNESVQNKFGSEDPYFESVPATRLDGRPSKKLKRRKKALPPGISEHDGRVLTKVKRRAYRLDMALCNFLGIRFGWSSVVAIIPFAGDTLDMLMALMVLRTCEQVEGGLPGSIKMRMLINIAVDFAVGLVPILGDIADALFRANTRNAMILENYLRAKGKKQLRQSGQPIPTIDPSSAMEYDRDLREPPPEYATETPVGHRSEVLGARSGAPQPAPGAPEQAQVRASRGWFGWKKTRPHDVEMGPQNDNSRTIQKQQRMI